MSLLFPSTLILNHSEEALSAPQGIRQVLSSILIRLTQKSISALSQANYLGILTWAIGFGLASRVSSDSTKMVLKDLASANQNQKKSLPSFIHLSKRQCDYGFFTHSCKHSWYHH